MHLMTFTNEEKHSHATLRIKSDIIEKPVTILESSLRYNEESCRALYFADEGK